MFANASFFGGYYVKTKPLFQERNRPLAVVDGSHRPFLSVATNFLAAYLTFRRSSCFALAYAANDIVLILLWSLAAATESNYLSVIVCFAAFLLNDCYGFICWRSMKARQAQNR